MSFQQEWADDELSEFDLADSSEPPDEGDPEEAVEERVGLVPDEANPADAAEQMIEVPVDDDDLDAG